MTSVMARMSGRGGEILAGAALDVLGVLFEQALVGVALDVAGHGRPVFLVDEIDDELAQLGRVLDLVLGLAKNEPEHAGLVTQLAQGGPVVLFELEALHARGDERGPAVFPGNG